MKISYLHVLKINGYNSPKFNQLLLSYVTSYLINFENIMHMHHHNKFNWKRLKCST